MSNLLEPWVLFRLAAGLLACALFVRAAWTSARVLRHWEVARATEGQLALERQVDLAWTFVRVATVVQVGALALSALSAERLSHGVRGAMCAYGVFAANPWGFPALFVTGGVALAAGVLAQLYAFDSRVRSMDLVRPLAAATLLVAPLAGVDLFFSARFLLNLDLSVTASCCSVQLDALAAGSGGFASGPRRLAAGLAPLAIAFSIALAYLATRKPVSLRVPLVALAGLVSLVALPIALTAAILEVAPYVFELPQHTCPFCLLKSGALALGYPLFGAIFLAAVWGAGAGASALLSRTAAARAALVSFARERLRREALAWLVVLVLGAAPIARYAVVAGGRSLFP
jgi:hypothetical protein